ncbi:MAG: hypothetical protein CMF50_00620 [Legionellales bacterium]|nr:hypothetical protein [Legionellales bacterium]
MPSFEEIQSERTRAQQTFQQLMKAVPKLFKVVHRFIEQTELSRCYQQTDNHKYFSIFSGVLRYIIRYNHSELCIELPKNHGSSFKSFTLGRRQSKKHKACHLDLFYTVKDVKTVAGAFGAVTKGAGTITATQPDAISCTRVSKLQPSKDDAPLYLKRHTQQDNFRVLKTFHHRSTLESTLYVARHEACHHRLVPHTHPKSYQDDIKDREIWFNIHGQPQITMRYLGQPVNPLSYVTRAQKLQAFINILQTYLEQIYEHDVFHLDLKIDNFLRDKRRGSNAREQYNIVDLGNLTREKSAHVHATHGYIPAESLRYRASFAENNRLILEKIDNQYPSASIDQFALAVIIEELLGLPESYLMIDLAYYNYDLLDEEERRRNEAAHSFWVQNGRPCYGFKWEDEAYDFSHNDIKTVNEQLKRLREEKKHLSVLLPGIIAKITALIKNSAQSINFKNEQQQHLTKISVKINGYITAINKFFQIISQSGGRDKLGYVSSQLNRLQEKFQSLQCSHAELNSRIQFGKILLIDCFVIFHQLINHIGQFVCAELKFGEDFRCWHSQQHDYLAQHGELSPALMAFLNTNIRNKLSYCMVFAQGRLWLKGVSDDNPARLACQYDSLRSDSDDTPFEAPATSESEYTSGSAHTVTSSSNSSAVSAIAPVSSAKNPVGFFRRAYKHKGKIALAAGAGVSVGGGTVGAAYGIMVLLVALGAATGFGLPVVALAISAAIVVGLPTATATTIWYGHSAAPAA